MDKKTLHIISLEIPYPPNKGSKIDIFFRIKALYDAGVEVILHAFYKEFSLPDELTKYCSKVYLLPRKKLWNFNSFDTPLYVQSRRSEEMMQVLVKDDHPILFEGLHTLNHFNDPRLNNRKKGIRLHNIESNYYQNLYNQESNFFSKIYYKLESDRSQKLEALLLPHTENIFSISRRESEILTSKKVQNIFLPPFVDNQISVSEGNGKYLLYHGDLSIIENENAALFIIENIMPQIQFPLIIAGNKPTKKIRNAAIQYPNIIIEASPSFKKMNELIANAQTILAPFNHNAGYKIKLLESLAKGRHVITSSNMNIHTELKDFVAFAETSQEWIELINIFQQKTFSRQIIEDRNKLFAIQFNNQQGAETIIRSFY